MIEWEEKVLRRYDAYGHEQMIKHIGTTRQMKRRQGRNQLTSGVLNDTKKKAGQNI